MKGLVDCNFLPGRLELEFQPSPPSRAYWSQNSGRSAKRLACRARVLLATDSAQAGRGPQWPIHRISAPANDAVRLPGARRLERQMTVTDGRAGHFRTVSAVVRVRPGTVRQAVGHRPGDRGRAHGGQSAARSYSPGRLPPRRAEGAPPPPLRLSNFGPTSCGLRPRRQPTMETTTALARLDPHATRFALAVARPTYRPLLSGQRHAIALQAERAQLAAISAHPAAMVGTGMPKLRGRTGNEAIVMPTAPSLERDSAPGRRTPGN
jgi:hypothetical protein